MKRPAPEASDAEELRYFLRGGLEQPEELISLWKAGSLCDVRLRAEGYAEGSTWPAHKIVIAGSSGYFRAFLTGDGWAHGSEVPHEGQILDVPASFVHVIEPLLEFIYTGKCDLSARELPTLMEAALYLQVDRLRDAAVEALVCADDGFLIEGESVLHWWDFSASHIPMLNKLAEGARRTALARFEELAAQPENVDGDLLLALLRDDALRVDEECAYEGAISWARTNKPREEVFLDHMRAIRFPQLSKDYVQRVVEAEPLLQTHAGRDLLFQAFKNAASSQLRNCHRLLTNGAVPRIYHGDSSSRPSLQVLSLTRIPATIPNAGADRYRFKLSDGQHTMTAMLATQLNQLVEAGRVGDLSIVVLEEYLVNMVQNRKIVIVLDVRFPESEVDALFRSRPHQIGKPEHW